MAMCVQFPLNKNNSFDNFWKGNEMWKKDEKDVGLIGRSLFMDITSPILIG